MNDNDLIRYWASLLESGPGRIVSEESTPSDMDEIMASFNSDVSPRKLVPTTKFLENAYRIFNRKFFGDRLPQRLVFQIKAQPTQSYVGLAYYEYNNRTGSVRAVAITLNSARTLTLHEWLEVVLHEMIHVLDYETNPRSFVGYMRRAYDAHGAWFLNEGKKYEKYGFHVQKYCAADIGVNDSNPRIKGRIQNSVFLYM